jgi:iron complex outermembrane receptor protein
MLFAGYGTGFRAGGYNDFAVQPPFAPETNASVEAGVKGDFFERRLSLSLTGYRNEYSNLQLRAGVPTGGAIITNAADSEIKGFEFEFNARPFEHTVISANTSYTDAVFKHFPKAVDIFNNFVDASGNHLPNAPRWQAFVSVGQEFPLKNGWTATTEINYRWRDTIYFYFTNQNATPWYDGPGGTLGARAALHSSDDKWTFAVFGTNLNDARIVQTDVVTFSYPEVSLNEPRVFGVSVDRKF